MQEYGEFTGSEEEAFNRGKAREKLNLLSALHLSAKERVIEAKKSLDIVEAQITDVFDKLYGEEVGEFAEVSADEKFTIQLSRGSRMVFDAALLNELYGSSEALPAHVKRKITIDAKAFEIATREEREALRPGMTIKTSKPKITTTAIKA